MTFREFEAVGDTEIGQSGAVSTEPKRKPGRARVAKVVLPLAEDETNGKGVEPVIEPEPTPTLSEEALKPSAALGQDPVRLYLKEIGRVPLLKAEQEVTIGRRIEVGQIALRRALGGIPLAVAKLLTLVEGVRHTEVPLDEVILLPEGREPLPDEIKPMLAAFARIRRLQREI